MKVSHLIKLLQNCHQDDEVVAWDADSESWEYVTGLVYGGEDGLVEIYTDDNS
jgi:hypothetical protein